MPPTPVVAQPVADVDDAGVLARSLDHPGRLGGQGLEMKSRGLVRAVLVPHRREDAELGELRRTADQRLQAIVFVRLEAVGGDQRGGDLGRLCLRRFSCCFGHGSKMSLPGMTRLRAEAPAADLTAVDTSAGEGPAIAARKRPQEMRRQGARVKPAGPAEDVVHTRLLGGTGHRQSGQKAPDDGHGLASSRVLLLMVKALESTCVSVR
jgi:hypothetical protein